MRNPEIPPLSYEQLEAFVHRLPELYKKHGILPDTGGHYRNTPGNPDHDLCLGCALETIACESGHSHWSKVCERSGVFADGFDGKRLYRLYVEDQRYYDLGVKAAIISGIREK